MDARRSTPDTDKLDALLAGWHHKSREAALVYAERHGMPDEATPMQLTWRDRGGWSRTTIHRAAIEHRWPLPHHDVIEQALPYRVDPRFAEDVLAFHGGLAIQRTRGELSILCESEAANACAINLVDDVLEGRIALHKARLLYALKFAVRATDTTDPYLQGLLVGRQVATADPDDPHEATPRMLPIERRERAEAARRERAR